jgi:outer membrane lipoprotein-sorting protein
LKHIRRLLIQCIWSTLLLPLGAAAMSVPELQKVLNHYQALEQLDVDFKQIKRLKDMKLELASEGHLRLQPPSRVEWEIRKPQPMMVVLSQDKITVKSDEKEEVYKLSEAGTTRDRRRLSDLLSWLRLDADEILKSFAAEKRSEQSYEFVAKSADPMIKRLALTLTLRGHVQRIVFFEASGDEIQMDFATPVLKYRLAQ